MVLLPDLNVSPSVSHIDLLKGPVVVIRKDELGDLRHPQPWKLDAKGILKRVGFLTSDGASFEFKYVVLLDKVSALDNLQVLMAVPWRNGVDTIPSQCSRQLVDRLIRI